METEILGQPHPQAVWGGGGVLGRAGQGQGQGLLVREPSSKPLRSGRKLVRAVPSGSRGVTGSCTLGPSFPLLSDACSSRPAAQLLGGRVPFSLGPRALRSSVPLLLPLEITGLSS